MKKIINAINILIVVTSLTSCASIVNGNQQSVTVKTGKIKDAACALSNNKGTWYINNTPGSVTVHRSYNPKFGS